MTSDAMADKVRRYLDERLPGRAPFTVAPLARGEYHENYLVTGRDDGTPQVFRINLGSQLHLDNQIGYEARALEILAPSGRTPIVSFVDPAGIDAHGVLLEQYRPGRPLEYARDLGQAAAVLADVHSVPVPADCGLLAPANTLDALLDECDAMFETYRGWAHRDASLTEWVENRLARARRLAQEAYSPDAPHPLHGGHVINTELNSGNFLIVDAEPGGAGDEGETTDAASDAFAAPSSLSFESSLVDWEKPLVGCVEQDLANFLSPTTTFWKTDTVLGPEERAAFLGLYVNAVRGRFACDAEGLSASMRPFVLAAFLRGVTWCAMALVESKEGWRKPADAYTEAKIRAYLTPEFLATGERLFG